jgi:hypothetical protein
MSAPIRIAAMSDLHIEFEGSPDPLTAAGIRRKERGHPIYGPSLSSEKRHQIDLMILAGDIDLGIRAVEYAGQVAAYLGCPTVLVPGNHEYYGGSIPATLIAMRALADELPDVHVLDCDELVLAIRDRWLRVLGTTLWTDYDYRDNPEFSAGMAAQAISDHRHIRTGPTSLFDPADALALHRAARTWLAERMAQPFDGPTVIVTHHGVSRYDVAPRFERDVMTPAFVSNLETEIREWRADIWITGHTHHSHDSTLFGTRLVSQQRGYPGELRRTFKPWVGEL